MCYVLLCGGCWEAVGDVDVFFSSTGGGSNIAILEHVKNNAIVGNTTLTTRLTSQAWEIEIRTGRLRSEMLRKCAVIERTSLSHPVAQLTCAACAHQVCVPNTVEVGNHLIQATVIECCAMLSLTEWLHFS